MPIEEWQRTHKSKAPPRNALGIDLQFATEQALRERNPVVLIIDDAQHIARVTSQRKLADNVLVLKSTVKKTQIRQLLTNTYALTALCNLDPQAARISREVYFHAYQLTDKDLISRLS